MSTNPKARVRQRKGLRAAADAHCRGCIHDPLSGGGTWREQVAQCSALDCPLWPHRPAPNSGPFANPCRDPQAVAEDWLLRPVGKAVSPAAEIDLHDDAEQLSVSGSVV